MSCQVVLKLASVGKTQDFEFLFFSGGNGGKIWQAIIQLIANRIFSYHIHVSKFYFITSEVGMQNYFFPRWIIWKRGQVSNEQIFILSFYAKELLKVFYFWSKNFMNTSVSFIKFWQKNYISKFRFVGSLLCGELGLVQSLFRSRAASSTEARKLCC